MLSEIQNQVLLIKMLVELGFYFASQHANPEFLDQVQKQ